MASAARYPALAPWSRRAALAGLGAVGWAGTWSHPVRAALADRFSAHDPASTRTVDHRPLADFLGHYLDVGSDGINRMRYGAVTRADRAALGAYLEALQRVEVNTLSRNEQFAFWANLYNAQTLAVVVDAYPVETIRAIRPSLFAIGPWKKPYLKVAGEALSLDDIEHGILRPGWKDPRVHYAVNCASLGCPNLWPEPFSGADLEPRLDAAAHAYVNHPRGIRIEAGKIVASKIYSWFQEDFGNSETGVLAHVAAYAEAGLARALARFKEIHGYEYDWALNDAGGG